MVTRLFPLLVAESECGLYELVRTSKEEYELRMFFDGRCRKAKYNIGEGVMEVLEILEILAAPGKVVFRAGTRAANL